MRFRKKRDKVKEIDPYKRGIFEPKRYYELLRKAVTDSTAASGSTARALDLSPACLANLHDRCNGYADTSVGADLGLECQCLHHSDD